MFRFEIDHLPADHSVDRARAMRDFFNDAHARFRRTLQPRQHFVSLGLQRVARENGDGLAEHHVAGGTSTAQVIVVERGQDRHG